MTSIVTALLVIGGIDYNAPFRTDTKPKPVGNQLIKAVTGTAKSAAGGGTASMEDALGDLTDTGAAAAGANGTPAEMEEALKKLSDLPDEMAKMAEGADGLHGEETKPEQTLMCIVYGVITNDERIPTSFLFAGKPQQSYQHVAEIRAEDLEKSEFLRLAVKLFQKVQPRPAIPTTYEAVWVKPVLICKIRYRNMNDDGTIRDATFDSIIRDESDRTASRNTRRRGR